MPDPKTKKRILFRADGNNEIGLGHIYRCIAIAERLKNEFDCFFAISKPNNDLKDLISKSFSLSILKEYKAYLAEAEEILNDVITRFKIDIITLDGYHFDTEYQKTLKKNQEVVIVSIDDDQPFHYVSDVVINHSRLLDNSVISKEPYTKICVGYDYLMLRKEFITLMNSPKEINGIKNMLICFGGSDPNDFTKEIINCLKNSKGINKINVVVGSHYAYLENLKQLIKHSDHIQLNVDLNTKALSELMKNSDLAIVPSSTMGLEAFASKMILLTGLTASNQKNIYCGLIQEETVFGIGDFINLKCATLLKCFEEACQKFEHYTFKSSYNTGDSLLKLYKSL